MGELRFDKIQFFIKRPDQKGRASFSIQKRVVLFEGKPRTETIQDERIDVLNRHYRSGEKSSAVVDIELKNIVDELYAQEKRRRKIWVPSEENVKVVEAYWEREYAHCNLVSHKTAQYDLWRAVQALGNLSLSSASEYDIRKTLNNNLRGDRKKIRRAIPRIRALLRSIGRHDVVLKLPKKPLLVEVDYLTESEFLEFLKHVHGYEGVSIETLHSLYRLCFYSGFRVGEAYYLADVGLDKLHGNVLLIDQQIRRAGEQADPKNGKRRKSILLDKGIEALKTWVAAKDRNGG